MLEGTDIPQEILFAGSSDYDPTLPWIAKMKLNGTLAVEFYIYVDDVRVTCGSEEQVWEAIRRICSIFGYLGIQDAGRKRRNPSSGGGLCRSIC